MGLSLTWSKKKRKFSSWQWKLEKFVDVVECWFMNLDMVKPGKYDHPHLFYHFTITLRLTIWLSSFWFIILEEDVVTRNIVNPVCFACKPFELLKLCFFFKFWLKEVYFCFYIDKFDKNSFLSRQNGRLLQIIMHESMYVHPSKIGGHTKIFYNQYIIAPARL